MLEVSNPTTAMNLDAEFQKALPLVESKFWSDFLQMAPGVMSRAHNDGSGRQNYFALGVEHREINVQMEGLFAGQLQRLQHQPDGPEHRGDSGHAGQDGRCRCLDPDGLRPLRQHDRQERRQHVLWLGLVCVPAVRLERQQRHSDGGRGRDVHHSGKSTRPTSLSAAPSGRTRCGSSAPSGFRRARQR